MVTDHPDLASSYVAGKSEESRELKVLVVKTPSSQRAVWIDCGFHAVCAFILIYILISSGHFLNSI
jgi:hypothetical protein